MIQITHGTPALVFAPMEGIAEAPMREFLSENGGFTFCVAEFLRISQEVLPPRSFLEHIPELKNGETTTSGIPVQVQLLGGHPERLALSAQVAARLGATAIDLNFGCPSPTVNQSDGGATLLKYPYRIREIVKSVRDTLPASIAVSAKLRLGWDHPSAIFENAEMAAEGGAAWITIHGRTRLQGYAPPADWESIGEVRKRLKIPVVANGEIWTIDDFKRCRDITGCEHFMLGRGALAHPNLPRFIAHELGISTHLPPSMNSEIPWNLLLKRFVEIAENFSDRPGYIPCRIKQWARIIDQRTPIAWYSAIKPLKKTQEILDCVQSFYSS